MIRILCILLLLPFLPGCTNRVDQHLTNAYAAEYNDTVKESFTGKQLYTCIIRDTFYTNDYSTENILVHNKWMKSVATQNKWQQQADGFGIFYALPDGSCLPPNVTPLRMVFGMDYNKDSSAIFSIHDPQIKYKRL